MGGATMENDDPYYFNDVIDGVGCGVEDAEMFLSDQMVLANEAIKAGNWTASRTYLKMAECFAFAIDAMNYLTAIEVHVGNILCCYSKDDKSPPLEALRSVWKMAHRSVTVDDQVEPLSAEGDADDDMIS